MAQQTFIGDVIITGNLSATGTFTGNIPRSSLILDNGADYSISPGDWRIWDAYATQLSSAPAGDDLGVFSGTYGTQIPYVRTPDLNASGGPNNYRARKLFHLPREYEIGQNLIVRFLAGMVTAVAGTSATIDVEAFQHTTDLGVGSDLVTTAAQSINSLAFSTYDFQVTGSGIGQPSRLDVRVTITTNSATASSHFAAFSRCEILVPIRS